MNEWEKPDAIEKVLAGSAAVLAGLAKLRDSISKAKSRKKSERKLAEEIDDLRTTMGKFMELMGVSVKTRTKFVEAEASFFEVMGKAVLLHDAQIKTLFDFAKRMSEIDTLQIQRLNAIEFASKELKGKSPRKRSKKDAPASGTLFLK
jgi:hypothetical protein